MCNWYKQSQSAYENFSNSTYKTYNDFGHPLEHSDVNDSDPIYLWWYSYGNIVTEKVEDAYQCHDDSHGMNFWGRYIANENALSLSWDPYNSDEETYLDVLLGLEEKFGKNVKLFISSFGKSLQGPTTIAQAIKKAHSFSESNKDFFNRQKPRIASKESEKYPELINDKIWQMFGVNLNTGERDRHPSKKPYSKNKKKNDCDCSHSMDMHCDGGDDGW